MKVAQDAQYRDEVSGPPTGTGWTTSVLRALVHAALALTFAWPISSASASFVACLASALGAITGVRAAGRETPLRLILFFSAAAVAMGLILTNGVQDFGFLVAEIGPEQAIRLGDMFLFAGSCFGISVALNALSIRRPSYAILEVAMGAMVFAQLVVAHRHGAINRPFELADPIIAAGEDPTTIFIFLGAGATALIVLVLMRERSPLRGMLHLMAVLAIIGIIVFTTQSGVLPPPPDGGGSGLGLRGQGGGGGQGGSSDQRNNDELEFRNHDENSENPAPVAVMLLHDDYSPPSGMYYLRQGAFSQYNGRRLVRAQMTGLNRDLVSRFPSARMPIAGAPELGPRRAPVETTVALLADHTRPPALESPMEVSPTRNPNPSRFRRVFRVKSAVLHREYEAFLEDEVGDPEWSEAIQRHYTEAPEDDRYAALAREVLAELPPHLAFNKVAHAMMITYWLGQVGTYSTRNGHADSEDPTADFLFGDRTGYCVHFAHAATFLMRSVGIPSRVATGYAVDEATRQGGSAVLITGQASHAWPEVFIAGAGWVPFDVSPQTVLDGGGSPPDAELQRLLGQMLREEDLVPPDQPSRVREAVGSFMEMLRGLGQGLGGLLISLLLLAWLIKAWRTLAPRFATPRSQARLRYRQALDRLGEVGVRRRRGESRVAFARRLGASYPTFGRLTGALEAARYGSQTLTEPQQLHDWVQAISHARSAQVPLLRRVRGACNPISWFWSR